MRRSLPDGAATTITTSAEPTTTAKPADADADAAPSPSPAPSSSSSPPAPPFDWRRCWYPVALVESLRADRPNALRLLGEPLVAWRPLTAKDGGWVVNPDACPHRLAPLSEGRLETDGTLQCSYHGWRFAPTGALALVPQLGDAAAHARACSPGGRGCAAVHPSRVVDGVLWAWGEAGGADVALRAFAAPPSSLAPETLAPGDGGEGGEGGGGGARAPQPWRANALGWYTRDLPLPFEMVMENHLDGSHVPFSHSGVMGDRDADNTLTMRAAGAGGAGAGATAAAAAASAAAAGGFAVRAQPSGRPAYSISFFPPGLVRYDFGGVAMLLHATPTAAGRSRIFLCVIEPPPSPSSPSSPPPSLLGRLLLPRGSPSDLDPRRLARWALGLKNRWVPLYHATNRNAVIDGDALLLYEAQRALERLSTGAAAAGAAAAAAAADGSDGLPAAAAALPPATSNGHGVDWRHLYYMPSSADLTVTAWRRWLDERGRGLPTLPANARALGLDPPPQALSRAGIFARYEQHTRQCPHCLRALAACNWGLGILAAVGFAALVFALVGVAAAGLSSSLLSAAGGWGGQPPPIPLQLQQQQIGAAVAAGVAALSAWAASALWKLRMLFISYDYKHAEH